MNGQTRVATGVPTGGQFSGIAHQESPVALVGMDPGDMDPGQDRCQQCGQWTSPDTAHICGARSALASRMDEVHHKVELANRRLARLGMTERFEVEILGERTQTQTGEGGERQARDMVDYRLNRPAVKLGDWTFAGRLDFLPDGTPIAMTAPDVELGGYRPDTRQCDHCGTARNRTSTYLLQDQQGLVKQVGSNCLEAFTGIAPKGLWALDWEAEDSDDAVDGFGSGGWERTATPSEILRMALAVTDNGRSYLSRQRAEWQGGLASGSLVREYLFPSPKLTETDDYRTAAEIAQDPQTAIRAEQVLDFAQHIEGEQDYPVNMRSLAGQERLTGKHVALMASAVAGWHRDQQKRIKEAADKAIPSLNEWAGSPKDKLVAVPATVTTVRYLDGDYGTTTLISMRDEKGRTLKWFASGHHDVDEGSQVVIDRASIKALDEYQGTKQTILTRAKLTPVEGESG